MKIDLSVVIPMGAGEIVPREMIQYLIDWKIASAPDFKIELIVSVPPDDETNYDLPTDVVIIKGSLGRAQQMNRAARTAQGLFIWFVHADSRLSDRALSSLKDFIQTSRRDKTDKLFFFRLGFYGHPMANINASAANLRARFLKLPFGDQAFCLRRSTFFRIGEFSESARYGEDHLLIWSAHRHGLKLAESPEAILTSARKYQTQGWLKTTVRHVFYTVNQALPQATSLFCETVFSKRKRRREMSIAIACLVKTPGLSPIKTRLAVGVGAATAAQVYEACCSVMKQCLQEATAADVNLKAYWAVAEASGLSGGRWTDFEAVSQGVGTLGERLKTVYDQLLSKYDAVIMIGADCPMLSPQLICQAIQILRDHRSVIGLTHDGGFYLFGSGEAFDQGRSREASPWLTTTYSIATTGESLLSNLARAGLKAPVHLPILRDLDVSADLVALKESLASKYFNDQSAERDWANSVSEEFKNIFDH